MLQWLKNFISLNTLSLEKKHRQEPYKSVIFL
jgi:hypothetical protein